MTGSGGSFDFAGGAIVGNPVINLQSIALTLGVAGTSAATFRMRASSTFSGNISSGQTLLVQGSDAGGAATLTSAAGFDNSGTVTLETIDGAHAVTFNVTAGNLANLATGVINVNQGAAGTRTLNLALGNAGTVNFNTSATFNKASATHLNSGDFNIVSPSATVTFTGAATTFTNQVAGTIAGIGTLNVSAITFTNDGAMSPGLSFGILTLSGDFTQSSSGVFNAGIGGRSAGANFDQFVVTGANGAATLDGTLNNQVDAAFEPCVSDRFLVLRYLSRVGQFATVNGANIGPTTFFDPVYEANGLTLEVKSSVPSVPQVCIDSPPDGSVFNSGSTILFEGIASDPEDGDISASIVWTSDLHPGFSTTGPSLSTSGLIDGVHVMTATVTDSSGNTGTDSITVTVSNTPPTVSITSPAGGSIFNSGSTIAILGTANDAEDGDISDNIVWTSNLHPGASASGAGASTDLLVDGVHTITATITDALGNVATDSITLTVSNTLPTVSITSPIDGASFASGATVNFAASANDAEDGDISASIVWTSDLHPGASGTGAGASTNLLKDGVHLITATVTDSLCNIATDTITITVGP